MEPMLEKMYRQTLSGINNSSFLSNIKTNISNSIAAKIKDTFGKEYLVSGATEKNFRNDQLFDWLKKYDNNYDLHYSEANQKLIDFSTLIHIDKRTIMYIATGYNVPNQITKSIYSRDNGNNSGDMYIYIFGKKSRKYWREIEDILENRNRRVKGNRIYNINEISRINNNISTTDFKKREMKNMYYSYNEKESINAHLKHFIENKKVYDEKQLLYKTGILLYGEPGTGKSSLAKAIATDYNRSIVTIAMHNIINIDFAELASLINNDDYDEYLILLEDIDTLFLNRAKINEKGADGKTYSDIINSLLQFLDSNTSPNNVIFVATTNHIELLDDALLRDGRFDLKVQVKGLEEKDVITMIESFGVNPKYTKEIIDKYIADMSQPQLNEGYEIRKTTEGPEYYEIESGKKVKKSDALRAGTGFVKGDLFNQSKLQNMIIKYVEK